MTPKNAFKSVITISICICFAIPIYAQTVPTINPKNIKLLYKTLKILKKMKESSEKGAEIFLGETMHFPQENIDKLKDFHVQLKNSNFDIELPFIPVKTEDALSYDKTKSEKAIKNLEKIKSGYEENLDYLDSNRAALNDLKNEMEDKIEFFDKTQKVLEEYMEVPISALQKDAFYAYTDIRDTVLPLLSDIRYTARDKIEEVDEISTERRREMEDFNNGLSLIKEAQSGISKGRSAKLKAEKALIDAQKTINPIDSEMEKLNVSMDEETENFLDFSDANKREIESMVNIVIKMARAKQEKLRKIRDEDLKRRKKQTFLEEPGKSPEGDAPAKKKPTPSAPKEKNKTQPKAKTKEKQQDNKQERKQERHDKDSQEPVEMRPAS